MTSWALWAALAASAPAPGSAHPLTIPFEKYTLPESGLTVILSRDTSLPVVAVDLWYKVGPLNEQPGRTGFAHLFEHLMFQGSKNVGEDQYFKYLEAAGASQINGTTGFDRTNYYEAVPSNQLELALWLESDRMGFLLDTLTRERLDGQREVVKEERRQTLENRPYGASGEKLFQTLFPKTHPYYGYVIGSMADLNSATLDDVRQFYTSYYAPANATLVIAGDFETEPTKALVAKYFGTLQPRAVTTVPKPAPALLTEEKRLTVKEPVRLPRLQMAWLSAPAFQPGDAEADILSFVLGGGKSSRLYQRLVYELQIAQSVSASQASYALNSIFSVVVTGRPGVALDQLELETQKVLDELARKPPTPREIERARNTILNDMVTSLQSVGGEGGKADTLNRYEFYLGDPGFLARDYARYESITPDKVVALAQSLLVKEHRVVINTEPAP